MHIVPPCLQDIEIIYQDNDVIVVNKPSGLLSVPGRHILNRDSVWWRLSLKFSSVEVVHRLDLDTSGLLVFALNKPALRFLNLQFQERKVRKEYIAQVWGKIQSKKGCINLPLRCDWPNRPKQMIDPIDGKYAKTVFEVMHHLDGTTLVLLKLITGRSHQLRVHMASVGHPVLGCEFYAHQSARLASERLRLHAKKLQFVHPQYHQWLSFESQSPF